MRFKARSPWWSQELHCGLKSRKVVARFEVSNLIQQVKEFKFDLAIVSVMTENRCLLIFLHVLGIPYISSFAMLEKWQIGIPALPSFVPHHYLPFDLYL